MQLLLLAAMASAQFAVTATGDLEWSAHYAEAKAAAAAAEKPLLVVLENPGEPQRRFHDDALASQPEQVDLLKHFQLCRVDVTTPYGKRVAEALARQSCRTRPSRTRRPSTSRNAVRARCRPRIGRKC